ncbi:MAG: cyclic-di-AMP receptor [Chloroflexota bacterium]
MKLVISIVHHDDSRKLIDTLLQHGHRATVISTTGGFLKEGNATVFVGVEDDSLNDVLDVIKQNCRTRSQHINPLPPIMEPGEMFVPSPIEVEVGGATVFVIDVEQFYRY